MRMLFNNLKSSFLPLKKLSIPKGFFGRILEAIFCNI